MALYHFLLVLHEINLLILFDEGKALKTPKKEKMKMTTTTTARTEDDDEGVDEKRPTRKGKVRRCRCRVYKQAVEERNQRVKGVKKQRRRSSQE